MHVRVGLAVTDGGEHCRELAGGDTLRCHGHDVRRCACPRDRPGRRWTRRRGRNADRWSQICAEEHHDAPIDVPLADMDMSLLDRPSLDALIAELEVEAATVGRDVHREMTRPPGDDNRHLLEPYQPGVVWLGQRRSIEHGE